jgi:thioredoxin 1
MMIYATEDTFDSLIQHPLVCVDFFADWCGPCHVLKPVLNRLEKEFGDVQFILVDTEVQTTVVESMNITSLPTLVFFKEGYEVDRILGYVNDDEISRRIVAIKEKKHV